MPVKIVVEDTAEGTTKSYGPFRSEEEAKEILDNNGRWWRNRASRCSPPAENDWFNRTCTWRHARIEDIEDKEKLLSPGRF